MYFEEHAPKTNETGRIGTFPDLIGFGTTLNKWGILLDTHYDFVHSARGDDQDEGSHLPLKPQWDAKLSLV